jgi:hypothetical protein
MHGNLCPYRIEFHIDLTFCIETCSQCSYKTNPNVFLSYVFLCRKNCMNWQRRAEELSALCAYEP